MRIRLNTVRRFSSHMNYVSVNSRTFLARVERLILVQGEALVLFRYARAAGNKDFVLFGDFGLFRTKLRGLPANTSVIVYGDQQLPVRGRVDRTFISDATEAIPDGSEYLILCLERSQLSSTSAGESHQELIADLEELDGRLVAVGLWPPWPDENPNVFEAYVPDDHGAITPGPY